MYNLQYANEDKDYYGFGVKKRILVWGRYGIWQKNSNIRMGNK